jgi:hypothetical protein
MNHAGHRRGTEYLFGGPCLMQVEQYGPLEWCCWRQSIVTGKTEVRAVVRADWPADRDPEDAFADDAVSGA